VETVTTPHAGDVSPARFAGWYRDLVELPRQRALEARGGEKTFKIVTAFGLAGMTAGACGIVNARFAASGDDAARIFGLPFDAALAVAAGGLGLLGYFGSESDYALSIGSGAFAAYLYRRAQRFSRERFAAPVAVEAQPVQQVRGTLGPAPVRGSAWPYNQHAGMTPQHQPQYAWSP